MSDVEAKLREKGLTADRIDEFRVAFQMFDINETGFITAENIGALLIGQFGQTYTAEDLDYMLKQFSDTGVVDFYNFALSMDAKMRDPRYNEAFADAFDLFDKEKKGELTVGALQEGMRALGEVLTDEEAADMLKVCKTKPEFVATMSQGGMVPSGGGGGAPPASSGAGVGAPAGGASKPAAAPAPAAAPKGPAPTVAAGRGGGAAGRGGAARGGRGGAARGGRGGAARGGRGASRGGRGASRGGRGASRGGRGASRGGRGASRGGRGRGGRGGGRGRGRGRGS